MSFTYDVTTQAGKVRLLCQDFDQSNPIFTDDEITAFLGLNPDGPPNDQIRLGAAQALDVIAASEVYVHKRIRTLDLTTDGPSEAVQLRILAAELRRQVNEGDGNHSGMFDWAEQVFDEFSERERIVKQYLRQAQ